MKRPTEPELIAREKAIATREREELHGSQEDIFAAIAFDRKERWQPIVDAMAVPPQLQTWVAQMTAAHGTPTVRIWRTEVPWLTALLVARWGEAECHWPAAFSDDDVRRARRWAQGDLPEGVLWALKQRALAAGGGS